MKELSWPIAGSVIAVIAIEVVCEAFGTDPPIERLALVAILYTLGSILAELKKLNKRR